MLCYIEPKTGAFNVAVGHFVQPAERLEQVLLILLRDTHSGVADGYFQHDLVFSGMFEINAHSNLARRGVLHGVCQQVQYDLPQPHFISGELRGKLRIVLYLKQQVFFLSPHYHHAVTVVH